MPHYRIYLLDENGHFLTATDVECADDVGAIRAAQLGGKPGQEFEVWSGTRCLGKVAAKPAL